MTDPLTDTTDGAPSQTAVDALLSALTNLIAGASTPESQQAPTLLLQRLALEGSVIPSRIPPPANITQVGGYVNLLTSLGESDLRSQLLGAALGLAGSTPLPGLAAPAPALPLVPIANDRGGGAVPVTVSLRSDMVAAWPSRWMPSTGPAGYCRYGRPARSRPPERPSRSTFSCISAGRY
jgi:hypothetical protein